MFQTYPSHQLDRLNALTKWKDTVVFVDMLKKMLELDPDRRITPTEVLHHSFITREHTDRPLPITSYARSSSAIMANFNDILNQDDAVDRSQQEPSSVPVDDQVKPLPDDTNQGKRKRRHEDQCYHNTARNPGEIAGPKAKRARRGMSVLARKKLQDDCGIKRKRDPEDKSGPGKKGSQDDNGGHDSARDPDDVAKPEKKRSCKDESAGPEREGACDGSQQDRSQQEPSSVPVDDQVKPLPEDKNQGKRKRDPEDKSSPGKKGHTMTTVVRTLRGIMKTLQNLKKKVLQG